MTDQFFEKVFYEVKNAIVDAGKIILDNCNNVTVYEKSTANFVTNIDLVIQEFFLENLPKIVPGCNIITEESSENNFNINDDTFILDPIDGTTNLMYLFNLSAISIGFFSNGTQIFGMVYNPFTQELFSAKRGAGAYLNNKQIKVSQTKILKDSLIGFGTAPYQRYNNNSFKIAHEIFVNCRDLRRTGAASLDLCYVACGRLDGFFEKRLQPWDYAGGNIIITEAGGRLTNWNNEQLGIVTSEAVIASNGLIHNELLEIINKFR